jgi:hypothetical protein
VRGHGEKAGSKRWCSARSLPESLEIDAMRLTRSRHSIPSLMIVVFVLSLMLAFSVDLRERARRKWALEAARAAYQNARNTRVIAESRAMSIRQGKWIDDATIMDLRSKVEDARADERARKAEYDRLRGRRTSLFW